MSISDELMWRYWMLLTDLRQSEIEAMQTAVAAGSLHPMEAKKRLARTIVAGFHSEEAAVAADENWARQFQQKSDDVEGLEEVHIATNDLNPDAEGRIRVTRLLTATGLAASSSEADRKVKEGAVRIDGEVSKQAHLALNGNADGATRITLRVGKRAKVAVIQ